jgi:hypothetical protein
VSGRGAAAVVALWALFNALLAVLLLGFRNSLVEMLSWVGAVTTLLVVVALGIRSADPGTRRLPEASAGALVLAVALAMLALGAGVGLWAALIGAGLAVVALVVLGREARE